MASENSKYYVGGTTVYGPRVHGHQKDRVEIASIAQATQPPGTWADDRIDAIKLLSDALNVKDTTGKTPRELAGEVERLRLACFKHDDEICQTLGKALGYPRYCDDKKNFPGATDADGVCIGDHVAESIAESAAKKIDQLAGRVKVLEQALTEIAEASFNDEPISAKWASDALARVNQPAAATEGAE